MLGKVTLIGWEKFYCAMQQNHRVERYAIFL